MTEVTEILEATGQGSGSGGVHQAIPPAKRNGPKGLLPHTWTTRTLRLSYRGADGRAQDTSGKLRDVYPFGPILSIAGAKTAFSWDAIVSCELVQD